MDIKNKSNFLEKASKINTNKEYLKLKGIRSGNSMATFYSLLSEMLSKKGIMNGH